MSELENLRSHVREMREGAERFVRRYASRRAAALPAAKLDAICGALGDISIDEAIAIIDREIKTEIANEPLNRIENQDGEGQQREWMVYGLAIVQASTRAEAIAKAQRGEVVEAWETLNDEGGFFRPEPYDRDVVTPNRDAQ